MHYDLVISSQTGVQSSMVATAALLFNAARAGIRSCNLRSYSMMAQYPPVPLFYNDLYEMLRAVAKLLGRKPWPGREVAVGRLIWRGLFRIDQTLWTFCCIVAWGA
eukprot:5823384-Pleurochrysis_carterae.AAC.1